MSNGDLRGNFARKMKKFKFRMQTILEIRAKKLEEEQLKLAALLEILNSQQEILEQMKSQAKKISDELNNLLQSENIEVDKICNYKSFLKNVSFDIQTQEELIKKTQAQIEEQKIALGEAYKELKILENLREKQQKEHYKHFEELEVKEIDDITISRYKKAS